MSDNHSFESVLRDVQSASESLGLKFALIGGLAVVVYGHARTTKDIDFLLLGADERVADVIAEFNSRGYRSRHSNPEEFARNSRMILLESPDNIELDIAMAGPIFDDVVVNEAKATQINDSLISVAKIEHLLVMKLIAGRDRDMQDCLRLIEIHPTVDDAYIRNTTTEFAELLESPEIIERMERVLSRPSA